MNIKKIILAVVATVLIVLQFFVKKDNVSSYESVVNFEQKVKLPTNVKSIMRENCYDCHSDHTNYPWYASIGAINLILNDHIEEGKEHLNFSAWDTYSDKRQLHKLEEVYDEVDEGEMPLETYTFIHGKLTDNEKELLKVWSSMYK